MNGVEETKHSTLNEPGASAQIYQVLLSVPPGQVVTYGQLARLCGLGRGARVVAAALKKLPSDTRVPWHRVINARGGISLPGSRGAEQRRRLEAEHIYCAQGRVDLSVYGWRPGRD